MLRALAVAVGVALLGVGVAAARRSTPAPVDPAALGTKIMSRLAKAGYGVTTARLVRAPGPSTGLVTGGDLTMARAPGEAISFFVRGDFACTCSFHFWVSVFDTHAHAAAYAKRREVQAKETATRLCRYRAACRTSPTRWIQAHRGAARNAVVGAVEFGAEADDAISVIPERDFRALVARASGTPLRR